jgi:hypothetical protein
MDKIFSQAPVEEKTRNFKKYISPKVIIYLIIFLLWLNLVYLDVIILQGGGIKTIEKIVQEPLSTQTNNKNNDEAFCSKACITKINEAATTTAKSFAQPSITPVPTKTPAVYQASSATKEYYVPFGSGTGSSSDWQDVSGLQAYVDSSAYGNIKNVVFEASLHVPTGNENTAVRLYNATDNHPVWYSELDFSGNTQSVFLSSKPISLDSGNKLYKVQMQTQLQYPAILDQSRLHITSN